MMLWKMSAYKDSFSDKERTAAEAAVAAAFPDDTKVERHLSRDDLALIVAVAVKVALGQP